LRAKNTNCKNKTIKQLLERIKKMQSRVNAQNMKKGKEENLEITKTECAQQSSSQRRALIP